MSSKVVSLEIITPSEMFYSGQVEMVVVTTDQGEEGFMANHSWCIKLLAKEGRIRIRQADGEKKVARVQGGHVDIKEHFVVYVDQARWE